MVCTFISEQTSFDDEANKEQTANTPFFALQFSELPMFACFPINGGIERPFGGQNVFFRPKGAAKKQQESDSNKKIHRFFIGNG